MSLARLRLYAINTFIAVLLAVLLLDALPLTPLGVRLALDPLVLRLGIYQGPWNLFAPIPVQTNTRLLAEITYRDGQQITWRMPDPRQKSAWQKWSGHRWRNFYVHLVTQEAAPIWEPWCRLLARAMRPDLPDADRGATVRVIYEEAPIPLAEIKPWPGLHEPPRFTIASVLTIEKLD
jgi:hypothetical protein